MALLRASSLRILPLDGAEQTPLAGPIDIELGEGDVLRVVGSSGAGKSTLLRCLALLEARALGEIQFRQVHICGERVPGFRREVVYVPQTPPRFPMTVKESLAIAFGFRIDSTSFPLDRARALCGRLLLADDILDRHLPRVSGGEAQRLGIVRALLLEPTVLLLDEPTSALDGDAEEAVHAAVESWFEKGKRAVICISHKREILASATSRRIRLHRGSLESSS